MSDIAEAFMQRGETVDRQWWRAAVSVGAWTIVVACALAGCEDPIESPGTNTTTGDTGSDAAADVGEPDSGGDEDTGPSGPAELATSVEEFVFKAVGQGNSEEVGLEVQNVGGSDVFITDVSITDEVGPDFGELALAEDAPSFPVVLEPGTFETLPLVYTPTDAAADRGTVVVEPVSEGVESLSVPFRSITKAPDLRAPGVVRIGDVAVGDSKTKAFDIINRGEETLTVQNIQAPSSSEMSVSYPTGSNPFPAGIPQDESFPVEVTFTPEDESVERQQLVIESNDPDDGNYAVTVTANRPDPCLAVNSLGIDFGEMTRVRETEPLTLLNCSNDRTLTVRSVAFSTDGGGAFSIESSSSQQAPSLPADVAPGQTLDLQVVAEMSKPREARGTLVVRTNDEARNPLLISVKAVYPE